MRDLEASGSSRLVPLDKGVIGKLLRLNPGYRRGVIPRQACPRWLGKDMETLAVPTVLACRADRPEEEVYEFARVIYERRETLGQLSPVYQGLNEADVVYVCEKVKEFLS